MVVLGIGEKRGEMDGAATRERKLGLYVRTWSSVYHYYQGKV